MFLRYFENFNQFTDTAIFEEEEEEEHQASNLLIQGESVGGKKLRLNEPSPLLLRQKKCVINILNVG